MMPMRIHKSMRKNFEVEQKVLPFHSHLKLFPGKLRSRWVRPLVVINVFPYSVVEIRSLKIDKEAKYSFVFNQCNITLVPLTSKQVYEDQVSLQRESE